MAFNLLERLESIFKPQTEYGCKRNDGDLSAMFEEEADVPPYPWPPDRQNQGAINAWNRWLSSRNLPPIQDNLSK